MYVFKVVTTSGEGDRIHYLVAISYNAVLMKLSGDDKIVDWAIKSIERLEGRYLGEVR